jgi:hypothetical protein
VSAGASTWCFVSADDRAWWANMWAARITDSAIAEQAIAMGVADEATLARISAAWRRFAADPDGWFTVLHGELIARKRSSDSPRIET